MFGTIVFFSLFHANNSDDSYSAYSHSRKDKQENAPLESRCNKIACCRPKMFMNTMLIIVFSDWFSVITVASPFMERRSNRRIQIVPLESVHGRLLRHGRQLEVDCFVSCRF